MSLIILWEILDLALAVFEIIIFYLIVDSISHKKDLKKHLNFNLFIFIFLTCLIHTFNPYPNARVIIILFMCIIFYKINFKVSLIRCIMISITFWVLVISLEAISMGIIIYSNEIKDTSLIANHSIYWLETALISKSSLFLVVLIIKYYNLKKRLVKNGFLYFFIPILTNLFSLVVIFIYILGNFETTTISRNVILFISLLYLFSNFSIIIVMGRVVKSNKFILDYKLKNEKNNMEYNYYLKIDENNYKVRKLYHDIKNHLICVGNLCDNDDAKQYVEKLNFQLDSINNTYNTGNKVLDIILNEKKSICVSKNINFDVEINFSFQEIIGMIDTCIIFGNLIDNAIQACEKIANNNRYINLKIIRNRGFCIIKIKNSKNTDIQKKKIKIVSDKEDKKSHGFGLSNVEEVIENNNGEIVINYTETEFIVNIIIPINES